LRLQGARGKLRDQLLWRAEAKQEVSEPHGQVQTSVVGDAKSFNNLRALRFSRGTVISREKRDWWVNPRL